MSKNCNYSGIKRGPKILPLSSDLKRIYRALSKTIMSWGFNVYVADSIRTRSRYLTIPIRQGQSIKIRLSDHPSRQQRDIDFDVYTREPRRKALSCDELMAVLEKRLRKKSTRVYKCEDSRRYWSERVMDT